MWTTLVIISLLIIGFILSIIFQKSQYRSHPAWIPILSVITIYFIYRIVDEGGGAGNIFAALLGLSLLVKHLYFNNKVRESLGLPAVKYEKENHLS